MSQKRTVTDFPRNEAGLVDNFLGTAYDVVKKVYDNLDAILAVGDVIEDLDDLAQEAVDEAMEEAMVEIDAAVDAANDAADRAEAAANSANGVFPFTFVLAQLSYDVTVISGDPTATTAGMALLIQGAIDYNYTILSSTTFRIDDGGFLEDGIEMRLMLNVRMDDFIHNLDEAEQARQDEFDEAMEDWSEQVVELGNDTYVLTARDTPVDYVGGLLINKASTAIVKDGVLYQPYISSLPFTTTTWTADVSKFFLAGDAALRQQLLSPSGSEIIANNFVVVQTIAELKLLKPFTAAKFAYVLNFHAAVKGGGGAYRLDETDQSSAEIPGINVPAMSNTGRWKLQHSGTVDVKQMGLISNVFDPNTLAYNDTVLQAARDWMVSGPQNNHLVFTPGIYGYTVSPNWGIADGIVRAEGEVKLRYFGTGHAVIFDAGPTPATDVVFNTTFGNAANKFIVECPSTAGAGVYIRSIHHSVFGFAVRGAGSGFAGILAEFAVCSEFNVTVSGNEEGWYLNSRPYAGLQLSERAPGETVSYCLFPNAIIEGPDIGIYLQHTLGNIFTGGTSEGCINYGVYGPVGANNDKFIGMDFEANGVADLYILGNNIDFSFCDTDGVVNIAGMFNVIRGGAHGDVRIDSGGICCSVIDCIVNRSNTGAVCTDDGVSTIVRGVRDAGSGLMVLSGRTSVDIPSLPANSGFQFTIPVVGLKFNDKIEVTCDHPLPGVMVSACVSVVGASGTALVSVYNVAGAPVDLAVGTWTVTATRG